MNLQIKESKNYKKAQCTIFFSAKECNHHEIPYTALSLKTIQDCNKTQKILKVQITIQKYRN